MKVWDRECALKFESPKDLKAIKFFCKKWWYWRGSGEVFQILQAVLRFVHTVGR